MCKHVAAVLYGVGARFDHQPELLFTLRHVDPADLLKKADQGIATAPARSARTLADDDVGALFGLEMDAEAATTPAAPLPTPKPPPGRSRRAPGTATRPRDPAARLLAALHTTGALDHAAARAATGLDAAAVRRLLKQLIADGQVRQEGQTRGTRYVALRRKQST